MSNVKYYVSAFSVFAIVGFIKLVEKLDSKNSSAIIYGFNFLLIIRGHAVYYLSYDRYMKFENNICNINRFENID